MSQGIAFSMWILTSSVVLCLLHYVSCDIENMPQFLIDDYEVDCMSVDTPLLPYIHIHWNEPYRAYKTLPPGLAITTSLIPDSGLGVISNIFIAKNTWLAEYEGEVIVNHDEISDYAWKVKRGGMDYFYVDGYDERTSNWLRWINCPRHWLEQNVDMYQCRGRVYYVTSRDIHPGQELLVYYGDNYAKTLNIDVDNYYS